jgi:Uma2 family endonuclease
MEMMETLIPVDYPSSDGERMAENTKQFDWIVKIKESLEILFSDRADVFVAGDNLIYPVEGDARTRRAPDVYVAFGRPKGFRGSYQVWNEGEIFPQVIFEVLSPGNSDLEMGLKREFYSRYGAEEYYVYDPDENSLEVWLRAEDELVRQEFEGDFTSPRLGVRFELRAPEMVIRHPNGQPFELPRELAKRLESEQQRAESEKQRADEAQRKVAELMAKLRELGVDTTTLG